MRRLIPMLILSLFGALALAQDPPSGKTQKKAEKASAKDGKAAAKGAPAVPPTFANVAYGTHPRQVLDFWKPESDKPTPLVVMIHGGGWVNGSKDNYARQVAPYLKAGIACAAINYRMVPEATEKGIDPPVKWPLEDAARAVQFLRSKAKEWNINPDRIGATGGSAGGCSSLYLALHDDLADPQSSDPIAKQSTRLYTAAVTGAQTTLDPKILREWMPNYRYGGHAFAIRTEKERDGAFQKFWEKREELMPKIKQYSPLEQVSKDDPAIFLEYPSQKKPPVKGENQDDPTHSALLGMILKEKLTEAGVECVLIYPGASHDKYKNSAAWLIDRLKK